MKPDKRLTALYYRYNKLYFESQLPDVNVFWVDMSETDAAGLNPTTELEDGQVFHDIYIDASLKHLGNYVKLTLLHEMVHVALHPWPHHGKRFHHEMLRLAVLGAFNDLW